MQSILKIPEWNPVGFKEEEGEDYPLFECVKCGKTCQFLIKGDVRLPDMCCMRSSKAKPINHQTEGEAPSERESNFLKTIQERGER